MILELYGLPGVGKTTVMNRLLEHGYPYLPMPHGKEKNIWYHLRHMFTPEFFHFAWCVWRLWRKAKHKDKRNCRLMIRLYLIDMQIRSDKDKNIYYCTDHGLIQTISSIVWQEEQLLSATIPIYRHLARYFTGEITYFYVQNPDTTEVYRRIQLRPEARRIKDLTREEAMDLMELESRLFEQAKEYLSTGCRVIDIDSEWSIS